jgi:hypothetical protein
MTDHDRPDAVAVPAIVSIAITIAIAVTVSVPIAVPIPEDAPIIIIIAIEAARAPAAIVKKLATHTHNLLGDAQLVLRQSSIGRAGEADRVGPAGQQRRPEDGCGGQRDKQQLVHFRTSHFAVRSG